MKARITNAYESSSAIVFVTTNKQLKHKGISWFVVPMNLEGFYFGAEEYKLWICASSTSNLIMDEGRVPTDYLIGEEGWGFKISMLTLDGG